MSKTTNRHNFNLRRKLEAAETELGERVRAAARREWRVVHGRRMVVTVLPCPSDLEEAS